MRNSDRELLDEVDAMVFYGDALYDIESIEEFSEFLEKWRKEVVRILLAIKEQEDEYTNKKDAK